MNALTATARPVILAARHLEYRYPGGVPALHGLSLEIKAGTRLAILGANGSGKSTLFLHLNGTFRPQGGAVLIDGHPAADDRPALAAWRSRVGLVLQDPDDQLFAATVYQDVSFGPLNLRLPEATVRERVSDALAVLGIDHLADRPTHMLSFGQKRRAALAGILAMRPEILLLDEPTAGLDPRSDGQFRASLDRLHAEGRTLVLSTHDVDLAYGWADEIAVFDKGRVLAHGPAADVLADQALMATAGFGQPVLLDLALRMQALGYPWPGGCAPRTRDALAALLPRPADRERTQESGPGQAE